MDIHLPIEEGFTPCESYCDHHKEGVFSPNFMYGEYLRYFDDVDSDKTPPKEALDWIEIDIHSFIPEEYRNRVELVHKRDTPDPHDTLEVVHTIGWKYTPEIMETPNGNETAEFIDSKISTDNFSATSYKKNGYRYTISKKKINE